MDRFPKKMSKQTLRTEVKDEIEMDWSNKRTWTAVKIVSFKKIIRLHVANFEAPRT